MPQETTETAPKATWWRAWIWPASVALFAMALTLIPYLVGASMADGRRYMWLGYNLDDSCVYLSWMRQAADGSLRALNLFTTDPQNGMALNPLFLALGRFARLTGLPIIGVYHGARLLFGLLLLLVAWKFVTATVADPKARKLAFLFVCFSSGLGWLPLWWADSPFNTPIDKWQPEAITFLSLYLSPLFCFSMALQAAILLLLFQGERAERARFAVGAGLCAFLLGLVHSYDVITIAAIWIGFLAVRTVSRPAVEKWKTAGSWLRGVLAAAIASPAVLYIFIQLKTETVFRARANVLTLSPPPAWVLLGYGLTFALALYAIWALLSKPAASAQPAPKPALPTSPTTWTTGLDATILLVAWLVMNIAVAYLPGVPFQRKMLQGAHFPVAMLAGIGAAALLAKASFARTRITYVAVVSGMTALLGVTNLRFVLRDLDNYAINLSQTKMQRTYLLPGEISALEWVRDNTPKDAAVQPLFWIALTPDRKIGVFDTSVACFTPGIAHRKVYCGHWGETPDFPDKLREMPRLLLPNIPEEAKIDLLRKMKVRYVIFSQKTPSDSLTDQIAPVFRGQTALPWYLSKVYSNPDADVYEIDAKVRSTP